MVPMRPAKSSSSDRGTTYNIRVAKQSHVLSWNCSFARDQDRRLYICPKILEFLFVIFSRPYDVGYRFHYEYKILVFDVDIFGIFQENGDNFVPSIYHFILGKLILILGPTTSNIVLCNDEDRIVTDLYRIYYVVGDGWNVKTSKYIS